MVADMSTSTTKQINAASLRLGGRQITYKMDDGSTQTVSISGSRTAVSIDGQGDDRANLTAGMMCKVSMPPDAEGDIEATEVVCEK
jgi:hypothetical protein